MPTGYRYLVPMVTVRRWAILLGTRHELTVVTTAQTNRLRALLLGGQDTERDLARATLTDPRPRRRGAAAGTTTGQPRTRWCGTARSDAWLTPCGRDVTR